MAVFRKARNCRSRSAGFAMNSVLIRVSVLGALLFAIVALSKRTFEIAAAPYELPVITAANDAGAPPQGKPAKLEPPSLAAFPQTLTRPIFFAGRKYPERAMANPLSEKTPESTPEAPEPARVTAANLRLRGVAKTAGGWKALIQGDEATPTWVELDQTVGQWGVIEIDENRVVLRSSQGETTLELYPPQSVN